MNSTDTRTQPVRILAGLVGGTIRSAGTKTLLIEVCHDLLDGWGNGGAIRKRMASPLRWLVSRALRPGDDGKPGGMTGGMGRLLTAWARKVNADHTSDPACHARSRGETIHEFLKNTDFGEIREMVEGSGTCTLRTVEAFNEQLWKYPAKVGSILGALLALANTGMRCLSAFLKPIEKRVGPDLLADLLLSLLKGLDAREAASLMNSANEFVRRLHTGNLLLAKAGKPLFQVYLTGLLEEALPLVDPSLLAKALTALAEDREAASHALADALRNHPDLALSTISSYGSRKTPLIRASSRMTRLYDELDREALSKAVSLGLSDLDTFEISRTFNTLLRLINDLHSNRPEMFSSLVGGIVDSLDTEELRAVLAWAVPEIMEAARPVLESAMPALEHALAASGGDR